VGVAVIGEHARGRELGDLHRAADGHVSQDPGHLIQGTPQRVEVLGIRYPHSPCGFPGRTTQKLTRLHYRGNRLIRLLIAHGYSFLALILLLCLS